MEGNIYGYFGGDGFRISTIKKWEKKCSVKTATTFIRTELLKSLKDDFPVIFEVCKQKNVGFFALPRLLFPYISFLGTLYKGKENSKSAMEFMLDYMGQVSESYKKFAGIYYIGYRHGLMHTHMPKLFSFEDKRFGWRVSFATAGSENRGDILEGNKIFYPELFYKDLCNAIDFYIKDFNDNEKGDELLENFKKGYVKMAKISEIEDVEGKNNQDFLRKSLKYLQEYGV